MHREVNLRALLGESPEIPPVVDFYGYRLEVIEIAPGEFCPQDVSVVVRIIDPVRRRLLREVHQSTGNVSPRERVDCSRERLIRSALLAAEDWLLLYVPEVSQRKREAKRLAGEELRKQRWNRLQALGGDSMLYLMEIEEGVSPSEMARIFDLMSAQQVNRMLLDYGLQSLGSDRRYVPSDPAYAAYSGPYRTLRWTPRGLKAFWDAGMERGWFEGGDARFVALMEERTIWFVF